MSVTGEVRYGGMFSPLFFSSPQWYIIMVVSSLKRCNSAGGNDGLDTGWGYLRCTVLIQLCF